MIWTFRLLLAGAVLTNTSCSNSSAPSFALPENIYTIDKVYDIANNNNASDLRVEASVSTLLKTSDLVEVRLVIVKSAQTFAAEKIATLAAGNYFSVALAAAEKQVIKPSNFKDSDGDAVVNGRPYKIYVATLGKQDTRQLSASQELTLQNKPVHAGDYVGTWEDLGPPGPGSFTVTLRIAEDYSAKMFFTANFVPYGKAPSTQDVTATFSVTGTAFSFAASQLIEKYTGGGAFTTGSGGGCAASKVLTGAVEDDVNLVFNTFNWSDCDGTRNVKLKFKRQ